MKFRIIAITLALCMFAGIALADSAVPQTEETQGFVTSTAMQALGTVTETDNLVWVVTRAFHLYPWNWYRSIRCPTPKIPSPTRDW